MVGVSWLRQLVGSVGGSAAELAGSVSRVGLGQCTVAAQTRPGDPMLLGCGGLKLTRGIGQYSMLFVFSLFNRKIMLSDARSVQNS